MSRSKIARKKNDPISHYQPDCDFASDQTRAGHAYEQGETGQALSRLYRNCQMPILCDAIGARVIATLGQTAAGIVRRRGVWILD
jgi:hypothetical protein